MNKIDKYINSIYKGINNYSNEIEDLKQEMKIHLMETVKDLQENGINEDESIKIAIERFGGELQIRRELNHVLRFQKVFVKNILIVSLFLLAISAILFITSYFVGQDSLKKYNVMDSQVKTVEDKLKSDGIPEVDTYLESLFESNNNELTYVAIKELPKDFLFSKNNDLFPGKIQYSYPDQIKKEYYHNRFGHEVDVNGSRYFLETGIKTSANVDYSGTYFSLSIIFLATCWVLLIIWSIMNIHGYGYLNIKWSILLSLTGIVGYFIFILSVNPKKAIK